MAKKMNRGLVALSSAAILSVYGLGYALSQPAAISLAAGSDGVVTAPATPSSTAAGTSGASAAASAAAAATGSATPISPGALASAPSSLAAATSSATQGAASTGLKDGTYAGSGTSRHGGVNVSVTVQNGRIVAAPITSVSTRYSQNVIAGLPAAVLGVQSAGINLVSGATDSSSAYVQAVQQALSKAGGSSATASGGSVQVSGPQGVIYSNGSVQNG